MSLKARMLTITTAGLLVGLTGCGSPATTADSTAPSAGTTSGPASPTTSAAATSPAPSASTPPAAQPALITIKDFAYTLPASVAPGAKVTVTNQDSQNHTVTSPGAFDVKVDGGGGTATFTAPTKPGSYMFVCTFHANMMGTLVVR